MAAVREIEVKAEAVRAPCIAYWLLVFACLMMQLFPVHDHSSQRGFQNHSVAVTLGGDDWAPPPGVSEMPILPAAAVELPENVPAIFNAAPANEALKRDFRSFDARGPPSYFEIDHS